jgi:hypothetical protein
LTFKHLCHCRTKACILAQKKLVSGVCSQKVTACFISAFVANHLQARCFVRVTHGQKSLNVRSGL